MAKQPQAKTEASAAGKAIITVVTHEADDTTITVEFDPPVLKEPSLREHLACVAVGSMVEAVNRFIAENKAAALAEGGTGANGEADKKEIR